MLCPLFYLLYSGHSSRLSSNITSSIHLLVDFEPEALASHPVLPLTGYIWAYFNIHQFEKLNGVIWFLHGMVSKPLTIFQGPSLYLPKLSTTSYLTPGKLSLERKAPVFPSWDSLYIHTPHTHTHARTHARTCTYTVLINGRTLEWIVEPWSTIQSLKTVH